MYGKSSHNYGILSITAVKDAVMPICVPIKDLKGDTVTVAHLFYQSQDYAQLV